MCKKSSHGEQVKTIYLTVLLRWNLMKVTASQ